MTSVCALPLGRESLCQTPTPREPASSPPRSILKRRRANTANGEEQLSGSTGECDGTGFTSPPSARGDRAIRLLLPKKRRISLTGLPTAAEEEAALAASLIASSSSPSSRPHPHGVDFDLFELGPLTVEDVSSTSAEKEYFTGTPPPRAELARTKKQLAAALREDALQAQLAASSGQTGPAALAEIRARRHFRAGASRYASALGPAGKRMEPAPLTASTDRSVRRVVGVSGFRISSRPLPVTQSGVPSARIVSRKESGLVARLEAANRERARMEADELEEAREMAAEAAAKAAAAAAAQQQAAAEQHHLTNHTIASQSANKEPILNTTQSIECDPRDSSLSPLPLSLVRASTPTPLVAADEDDAEVFSPRSDPSSEDDAEEDELELDTGANGNEAECEEEMSAIVEEEDEITNDEEEVDIRMEDVKTPTVDLTAVSEDEAVRDLRTPIRDDPSDPEAVVCDQSSAPPSLLLAPKKRRSLTLASPAVAAATMAYADFHAPTTSSRSAAAASASAAPRSTIKPAGLRRAGVRRSLLTEMIEGDAAAVAAERDEVPLILDARVRDAPPGLSPVQALLATIRQDAADAILHNGRVYVPLPAANINDINAARAAAATMNVPEVCRAPRVIEASESTSGAVPILKAEVPVAAAAAVTRSDSLCIPESPAMMHDEEPIAEPAPMSVAAPPAPTAAVAAPRPKFVIEFEKEPEKSSRGRAPRARTLADAVATTKKVPREISFLTDSLSVHEVAPTKRRSVGGSGSSAGSSASSSTVRFNATPRHSSPATANRDASKTPRRATARSRTLATSNTAASNASIEPSSPAVSESSAHSSRHTPSREVAHLYDSLTVEVGPRSSRHQLRQTQAVASPTKADTSATASSPSRHPRASRRSARHQSTSVSSSPASSAAAPSDSAAASTSFSRVIAPDGSIYQIQTASQQREHDSQVFAVEDVISRRVNKGRTQWLVRWTHWPAVFDSWERREYFMTQSPNDMLAEYQKKAEATTTAAATDDDDDDEDDDQ